jgi:hypothetical protein
MTYVSNQEISASAGLTGIRHMKHGDVVTGKMHIEGSSRKLVSANLECFALYIGAHKSRSIWVDSYVDYLRGGWPAHNGAISVGVYWDMPDDMKLSEAELRDARLAVDNPAPTATCFEFTAQSEHASTTP